ncbi:MAG TPA: MBL fold metallo-hydrolase [Gemmatimonadales bacterium]|nr:MBL fold metallo-hydrolase [Gemmatimonadales bacterium]
MTLTKVRNLFEAARRTSRIRKEMAELDRGVSLRSAPRRPDPAAWPDTGIHAAWLGHATVLLKVEGKLILTDPVLSRKVGIRVAGHTVGPRRHVLPALRVEELPRPDLLLLSHAHFDHLDLPTLRRIPRDVPVVSAHGLGDLLKRFHHRTELKWGMTAEVAGIRVGALEVKHWGARMVTDRHRGYAGFLLEHGRRRVVFAGDTAMTDAFRKVSGPVHLALMPIGAYDPWIANHADPEEAWAMAGMMGAERVLAIHHQTFRLSREPMDEPIRRFLAVAGSEAWRVSGREVGETVSIG